MRRNKAASYLRYLVKTPTNVAGHYAEYSFANRRKAIALASGRGGLVLDLLVRVGRGFEIVFQSEIVDDGRGNAASGGIKETARS